MVRPHDKQSTLEIQPEQEKRSANCEAFALGRRVVPFGSWQDPAPITHGLVFPSWFFLEKNAPDLAGARVRIHDVLYVPPREGQ